MADAGRLDLDPDLARGDRRRLDVVADLERVVADFVENRGLHCRTSLQEQRALRAHVDGFLHLVEQLGRRMEVADIEVVVVIDGEDLRQDALADRVGLALVPVDDDLCIVDRSRPK